MTEPEFAPLYPARCAFRGQVSLERAEAYLKELTDEVKKADADPQTYSVTRASLADSLSIIRVQIELGVAWTGRADIKTSLEYPRKAPVRLDSKGVFGQGRD
jgi:hypothetical protein